MYLAGESRNYPMYCPVYACGVINCHDHRERDEERTTQSLPKIDSFDYKIYRFFSKVIGGVFTYYLLMSYALHPDEVHGHDWNNYEWDDWEYYADEQAEQDPSKAKFMWE